MKILVTDSFCSSNRGDAAILDGILTGLAARLPEAHIEVVSHYPAVCARFHGVEALDDRDAVALAAAVRGADLVVSCGGSFLNDIYGLNLHPRLATFGLARRFEVPYVLCAQSIGPLDRPLSRTAAREALDGAAWILARDEASARLVRDLGVKAPVSVGVDAAVGAAPRTRVRGDGPPRLGVTVRDWHFPGHEDAAARQAGFEEAVARACRRWQGATGGAVRFLANCTAYGGYHKDDRPAARRVAAQLDDAEVVEADDLGFEAVRDLVADCDLLLGTRMHSLIFATTAGVPAVGVAYEFKTGEWLDQVGLADRWVPIEDPEGLDELVLRAWESREADAARMSDRMQGLHARWSAQFDVLADIARTGVPGPDDAPRRLAGGPIVRGDWTSETFTYDIAHRRLRAVADAVLAEGGARVLDLGCSTGKLGRMLGPAYAYEGLDLSPDVACEEPGFTVRTADLDGPWPVDGLFDTVVCSGSLEYVCSLPGTLRRIREVLAPGGLAVVTLLNLSHISRATRASRHPTWRFVERPDELALALLAAGLRPMRFHATSAGYGPSPSVRAEQPTDHDGDGGGQLAPGRMVRLAHQWMVVCEASDPVPGAGRIEELAAAGDLSGALSLAVGLYRALPWSSRLLSDIAVITNLAGDSARARELLAQAVALDPLAEGPRANLVALGGSVPRGQGVEGAELALMLSPGADAAQHLVEQLARAGRMRSAGTVRASFGAGGGRAAGAAAAAGLQEPA